MKLYLYILREHITPFLISLAITTFLFMVDFVIRTLDLIISKHIDVIIVLEIFVLNLAWMLALSIPMSCLISSVLAYGRLSSDLEILILRTQGYSPWKILRPAIFAGSFFFLFIFWFNDQILPKANYKSTSLRSDLARKKAPALINIKTILHDFPGYKIWIDSADYKNNSLHHIRIYQIKSNKNPARYIYANTANIKYSQDGEKIILNLQQGEDHVLEKNQNYQRIKFKEKIISINNIESDLVRKNRNHKSDRELSIKEMNEIIHKAKNTEEQLLSNLRKQVLKPIKKYQLKNDSNANKDTSIMSQADNLLLEYQSKIFGEEKRNLIRRLEKEKRYVNQYKKDLQKERIRQNKYKVEVHKKISLAFACLLFFLCGSSLGMTSVKGKIWLECFICSFLFIIYWACLLRGESLADKLIIPAWFSMWLPNMILALFCVWNIKRSFKKVSQL